MKRGDSGMCLVVGVDKPEGKSSHDVVNACRRIFGERRVGHTGTLDPLATGALVVCVGPATRLDAYMVGHDKTYDVRISFGAATDTDDKLGEVIRTLDVPAQVCDPEFAQVILSGFVGKQKQMPPAYSAIKKGGVKACDAARKGNVIALEPRDIEVYSAELLDLERDPRADSIWWDVRFSVSKGTYIRALARDVGAACETCAHVERCAAREQACLMWKTACRSTPWNATASRLRSIQSFFSKAVWRFWTMRRMPMCAMASRFTRRSFPYMKRRTVLMPTIAVRGDAPCLRRVRFTMASSCAWCMATI